MLLDHPRLLCGPLAAAAAGALPPGRYAPPDLIAVQSVPQGAGRGTKLALYLRQRPRAGDQPVHQIRPHARKAQLSHAVGGALLGGALALAGQLWRREGWGMSWSAMARPMAAWWCQGGRRAGDAPAVVQQGLQARAEVREA